MLKVTNCQENANQIHNEIIALLLSERLDLIGQEITSFGEHVKKVEPSCTVG